VIGAYAVGVHGHPRATKDLDIWIEASPENASRVMDALRQFGAPLMGLSEQDLATPGIGFMMGVPPRRIDVLTHISGVEFADAWPHRVEAAFGEALRCPVIGLENLIANKRAVDRAQDRADVEALERLRELRRRG
jgi:hypothetical protein